MKRVKPNSERMWIPQYKESQITNNVIGEISIDICVDLQTNFNRAYGGYGYGTRNEEVKTILDFAL